GDDRRARGRGGLALMPVLPDRGAATRLVLVRHAETDTSAEGRCYGRLDVGLSAEGRRRSEELGAALAATPLAAVYSSPSTRALDTAVAVASPQGLAPVVDDRLFEIDFGELEGLTFDEIRRRWAALYREWMERPTQVTFPGGESFADLRSRVLSAVARIRERHEADAVAVVAHGGVVRVVLAEVLELPERAIFRFGLDFGGVTVVDWLDGTAVMRAVNVLLYSRA
ncbi:MAG: alpha-ribazole phosphatase, partial [Gaiellaceae bacterium]